jgi:hypothetical protein
MGHRSLCSLLISMSLIAGCGGSPSSPSPVSGTSSASVESAVRSAMTQAMTQIAINGRSLGDPFTSPCDGGGSIVMTVTPLPQQQPNVFGASIRIEYRDCTRQAVTITGDPYLESTMQSSGALGTGGPSVMTMQTIGGVRITSNGVQGRVQFNCSTTSTISVPAGSTPPQVSISSSGTITFEQPLGSTPVVRPCGPA